MLDFISKNLYQIFSMSNMTKDIEQKSEKGQHLCRIGQKERRNVGT